MTPFTKPASDSPLDRLPAEVITQTLEYVFAGRSRHAGSCRLVCQSLHNLSSPYLLRTVVVAQRLDALRKLREVVDHPYFSKHVTTLIWDASYYDAGRATEYNDYQLAFENACHLDRSRDIDYLLARQNDERLLAELRTQLDVVSRTPRSSSGAGRLLQQNIPATIGGQQGFYRKTERSKDLLQSGTTNYMTAISNTKLLNDAYDYQDRNHMRGCHLGFADYARLWMNQGLIRGDLVNKNCDSRRDLGREYFLEAVRKMPKLCHLAYSDYRELAYDDESYSQLCQRLFGDTVCPSLSYYSEYSDAQQRFQDFLEDLRRCNKAWDSLSIGRHPFEFVYHDSLIYFSENFEDSWDYFHDMVSMPFKALFIKTPERRNITPLTLAVRSLSLPTLYRNHEPLPDEEESPRIVTVGLVQLDIRARDFDARYYSIKDPHHQGDDDDSDDETHRENDHEEFIRLLLSPSRRLEWKSVHSLTMRGFVLNTDCLRRLLLDQVPALRTLRIIDCHCTEVYDDALKNMKEKISPFIKITGVEIFGLRFTELPNETEDHEFAEEYRMQMSARNKIDYNKHVEEGESFVGLLISDWPYERPELEAALMGARANTAVRKVEGRQDDQHRRRWQGTPRGQSHATIASCT